MKVILSPWTFLPFHFGISFPLNKWTGSGFAQLIMLIFNMMHYIAEHWASSFPNLSEFIYAHHLNDVPQKLQYFGLFYFSYYNCGKNKSLVRNWFLAMIIFKQIVAFLGGVGMAMPTAEGQIQAIEKNEMYNIAHLVIHCFNFVMAWHVASVVDVSNGLKRGWIVDRIEKYVKNLDFSAVNSFYALWASLAVCIGTTALAVAVEILKAANDGTVPLFPPMCRAAVSELDDCTFFGKTIPCFKVFNQDTVDHFGMGMEMGAIWTFVITFIIGFVSLCKVLDEMWFNGNDTWLVSSLKISCALYAMETAFFALIRYYWGVCKPLVAAAALHNLCEWGILLSMTSSYKEFQRYLALAALFITFIVTLCISIPNLFLSLVLEQCVGIMLDFGMPLMFAMQLLDSEKRKIYRLPSLAHTVHIFGTILPLIFSILLSNHVSWFSTFFLEILINVSVPAAHFIYCYWSFKLESIVSKVLNAPPPVQQPGRRFTTIRFSLLGSMEEDDVPSVVDVTPDASSGSPSSDPAGASMNEENETPLSPRVKWKTEGVTWKSEEPSVPSITSEENSSVDEGLLPSKYRINKVERGLVLGFILGVFTVAYIPLMYMPECDAPPCFTQRYVSKTSMLTLSEGMLEPGGHKDAVQNLPGLIDLHLGRARHDVGAEKYFMVEKWSSTDNMTDDILPRIVGSPSGDASIDEATKRWELDVTTVSTMTCPSERIDSIEVQPQRSCKKLWKILDSPGYCAWMPGCKFAEPQSDPSSFPLFHQVQLLMEGGKRLPAIIEKNQKEMKIAVSVLSETELPGYSAVMTLEKPVQGNGNKSCYLKYESRINAAYLSSRSKHFADNFNEYFLPDIYTRLRHAI